MTSGVESRIEKRDWRRNDPCVRGNHGEADEWCPSGRWNHRRAGAHAGPTILRCAQPVGCGTGQLSAHGQPARLESHTSAAHASACRRIANRRDHWPHRVWDLDWHNRSAMSAIKLDVPGPCGAGFDVVMPSTPGRSTRSVCTGCGAQSSTSMLPVTTCTSGNVVGDLKASRRSQCNERAAGRISTALRCFFRLRCTSERGRIPEHHLPCGTRHHLRNPRPLE